MEILVLISYLLLAITVVTTAALAYLGRKYYVIYHHNLLYIVGLEFSRSLTDYAVITVLMWYFTYYGGDLVMSAVLSNIQDALSSILVIVMANMADSFVGRFRTLLFSNTAYIGGLLLLWMFNPYDIKWLVVVALILLSFGTSVDNLLEGVLIDLVKDFDKSNDKERSRVRAKMWSRVAYVYGAISATLWVAPSATGGVDQTWRSTFLICIIAITTTLLVFLKGCNVYHQEVVIQRPVMMFYRVFRDGIKKRLKCSDDSKRFTVPSRHQASTTHDTELWQEDGNYMIDSREQEKAKVWSLLRIFPIWGAFFVVALMSATGSTFFIEQYSNLNTNEKLPIQIYNLIQEVSSFGIPYIYSWVTRSHKNEKIKMGVGMLCSIICCIFAWQLEVHRLNEVKTLVDQDENTSIKFPWLIPQFVMLGCMEGLTNDGLLKFFKSQVNDEDLKGYAEEYIEVVMGVGKLFNIALILIFKSRFGWFTYTINDSRLDKYYRVLVYICSANFVYYCCIATLFFRENTDNDSENDRDNDGSHHSFSLI